MRLRRSTGALSGLIIIALGLWGALIPFIGPYFHYSIGTHTAWHFTTNRLWLDILPGALAVLGGLMLLGAATRPSGGLGAWMAIIAGAWFVVGPTVSLLWAGHGAAGLGTPIGGHDRAALELFGFFYGVGALILGFAAFSLGRFASRPAIVHEGAIAGAATGATAGVATGNVRRVPRGRRRFAIGRRREARTDEPADHR